VNAPLVVVLLDDARLADAALALFDLPMVDASISRLLVRRLVRHTAPAEIPAQVAHSAPFAALVLSGAASEAPAFARASERLRADHDRALKHAGMLDERTALEHALAMLDDPARKVAPLEAVVADSRAFAGKLRHRFATSLAERARAQLEWRARAPTAAAPATYDAVVTALRWAARGDDATARRLIASALSGVPSIDARALIAAAGTRSTLADAIAAQRPVVGERSRAAALRFSSGLDAIRNAYRAQGARAVELVATIAGELDLSSADVTLLGEVVRIARNLDAVDELTSSEWEIDELIASLDDELDLAVTGVRVPPAAEARVAPSPKQRPLPPRRGHFSASALNTFAECRRKWFFRYLCSAVEDKGSAASLYGTAFHSALESFHARFPHVAELDLRTVQAHLEGCITVAFDRYRDGFESNVEFELQRRRAIRTVRKYGEWLVARSNDAPFTVAGCEISTELVLDGFDFVGFIDRLDRDDRTGEMAVIDYKTGSIATSAAEYREKVLSFEDFQLPFYYWARTEAGDRVTRLVLLPLKEATADVLPIELEVVPGSAVQKSNGKRIARAIVGTISIDELRIARAKMIELCTDISSGTLEHFPAAVDPSACRYCAYRAACRERPATNEDRFGR
jgi:RecB family exonuclease